MWFKLPSFRSVVRMVHCVFWIQTQWVDDALERRSQSDPILLVFKQTFQDVLKLQWLNIAFYIMGFKGFTDFSVLCLIYYVRLCRRRTEARNRKLCLDPAEPVGPAVCTCWKVLVFRGSRTCGNVWKWWNPENDTFTLQSMQSSMCFWPFCTYSYTPALTIPPYLLGWLVILSVWTYRLEIYIPVNISIYILYLEQNNRFFLFPYCTFDDSWLQTNRNPDVMHDDIFTVFFLPSICDYLKFRSVSISLSLGVPVIFLFSWGVKDLPVLPRILCLFKGETQISQIAGVDV